MGEQIKIKAVSGFGVIFDKLKEEIDQIKEAMGINKGEFLKDGRYDNRKLDNMHRGTATVLRVGFLAIIGGSSLLLSGALSTNPVAISAEASVLKEGVSINSAFETRRMEVKDIPALRMDKNTTFERDLKAEEKLKETLKRVKSERPDISRNDTMRPGIGMQSY